MFYHCEDLRETFISHYSIRRDVRALSNACNYIMAGGGSTGVGNTSNNKLGLESAMHVFKTMKGTSSNNLKGNERAATREMLVFGSPR